MEYSYHRFPEWLRCHMHAHATRSTGVHHSTCLDNNIVVRTGLDRTRTITGFEASTLRGTALILLPHTNTDTYLQINDYSDSSNCDLARKTRRIHLNPHEVEKVALRHLSVTQLYTARRVRKETGSALRTLGQSHVVCSKIKCRWLPAPHVQEALPLRGERNLDGRHE
ncbi:hypothetical protein PLICRDRAFT_46443 [Plicaturopsis crispa FD-325 SS-3]|uniref:Uncharacterized protein n=1 Tax=Plicaturopsis crispa FD-325 SS-3 TaxID=944288 RepID=A0A0C9T464_PLICR|nr:hypothetical protein PLICRDRAFT_46443 [Plicaturopsis crispa FD-325 SS-3]